VRALLPPILLAAAATFGQPLWADTAASLQALDSCLDKLALHEANAPGAVNSPKPLRGIDRLRPICPDLEHALIDFPLRDQLPEHWQDSLDRSGISDLSALMRRYASPALSAVPRVPTLYQVAQTLNQPQPRRSWWQDFKDWLRQLLVPPASSEPSWLTRWLSRVSPAPLLMRSIFYALFGAILLMALWIVWRELKAAGVGAAAAKRVARRSPDLLSPAGAKPLNLDDIDAAPLGAQPALLLRLLVQALLQSGRLKNERSLTHRELGAHSAFDDPEQHGRFVRISLLAERLLYGPDAPCASAGPPPQIDHALTDGRQLYAQLLARRGEAR
jgi:hypothetical protein